MEETHFEIRKDHEVIRRILTMAEATGKLAAWIFRLLQSKFDVFHCSEMKHHAFYRVSRVMDNSENETFLDDEVTVRTIPQELFACSSRT